MNMENNTNNNRTPSLRFSGFEGDWEVKKLGEIADKCTSRNKDKTVTRVLTNSATDGVVDQNAYFERDIAVKENTDNYHIVDVDDFVYNPRISVSAPVGPISRNKIGRGIMSPLYSVFHFKSENVDYLEHFFNTTIWHKYLKEVANYGARFDRMAISTEDFYSMPILLPSLPEQQKIAECLGSVDDLIQAEADRLQALKDHKKGLMQQLFPQEGKTTPKLRFPGFEGEWEEKKLGEVCNSITPPLKLQSSDYLSAGKYPVIDQSQSLICGWTNEDNGLITNVPVIIFGDHTCALKYIDFPFVQGADGVKILSPKNGYNPQFVYQAFVSNPVKQDGYKRHFSDFKEKIYYFPNTLPEQQKIADCLSSLDEEISAQQRKVETLKEHKRGLMQKLFPNEQ